MIENNIPQQIDLIAILKKLIKNKRTYFYSLPIAFIVSCLLILSVPRYYTCEVKLAPEAGGLAVGGSLTSLASSFGLDMGKSLDNGDAISPELYPDLMMSADFAVSLFPMHVSTMEGDVKTSYYTYINEYTKAPWWGYALGWIKNLFAQKDTGGQQGRGVNPFMLTRKQMDVVEAMQGNISCNVDKKTNVISISVTDQDPLVCATMADSVRVKLQDFITRYRTNKAKIDLEYTKKLYSNAKKEYEKARQVYASYSDANQDVILQSFVSKKEDLENDMQLKFNTYSTLTMQYQAALAKVQERTPAFTILQGASVPIRPAGPKRMIFVAVMLFLTFIGTSVYIVMRK